MLFLSEREKGFEMGLFDYKNSIIMDKCDKAYKGEKVMVLTSKRVNTSLKFLFLFLRRKKVIIMTIDTCQQMR